jgi:hypothetical protein
MFVIYCKKIRVPHIKALTPRFLPIKPFFTRKIWFKTNPFKTACHPESGRSANSTQPSLLILLCNDERRDHHSRPSGCPIPSILRFLRNKVRRRPASTSIEVLYVLRPAVIGLDQEKTFIGILTCIYPSHSTSYSGHSTADQRNTAK